MRLDFVMMLAHSIMTPPIHPPSLIYRSRHATNQSWSLLLFATPPLFTTHSPPQVHSHEAAKQLTIKGALPTRFNLVTTWALTKYCIQHSWHRYPSQTQLHIQHHGIHYSNANSTINSSLDTHTQSTEKKKRSTRKKDLNHHGTNSSIDTSSLNTYNQSTEKKKRTTKKQTSTLVENPRDSCPSDPVSSSASVSKCAWASDPSSASGSASTSPSDSPPSSFSSSCKIPILAFIDIEPILTLALSSDPKRNKFLQYAVDPDPDPKAQLQSQSQSQPPPTDAVNNYFVKELLVPMTRIIQSEHVAHASCAYLMVRRELYRKYAQVRHMCDYARAWGVHVLRLETHSAGTGGIEALLTKIDIDLSTKQPHNRGRRRQASALSWSSPSAPTWNPHTTTGWNDAVATVFRSVLSSSSSSSSSSLVLITDKEAISMALLPYFPSLTVIALHHSRNFLEKSKIYTLETLKAPANSYNNSTLSDLQKVQHALAFLPELPYKTAITLINKFGSLPAVLEAAQNNTIGNASQAKIVADLKDNFIHRLHHYNNDLPLDKVVFHSDIPLLTQPPHYDALTLTKDFADNAIKYIDQDHPNWQKKDLMALINPLSPQIIRNTQNHTQLKNSIASTPSSIASSNGHSSVPQSPRATDKPPPKSATASDTIITNPTLNEPSTQNTIFIVDAFNILYRAYHALYNVNMRSSILDLDTRAIYGFTMTILLLLEKYCPPTSPLVVVFDAAGKKDFRTSTFKDYKANRPPTPIALKQAIPWVHQLIKLLGIHSILVDEYEADDVIGTLVRKALESRCSAAIVSSDKDFNQLLRQGAVQILRPGNKDRDWEWITEQLFREAHQNLDPPQFIDVLALIGDSADNVPGVKGIGIKSALKLIGQYNSVENIFDNVDAMKTSALKTALLQGKDDAIQGKYLVTIRDDVVLQDFDLSQLERAEIQLDQLKLLFEQFQFAPTFIKRAHAVAENAKTHLTSSGNNTHPTSPSSDASLVTMAASTKENSGSERESFVHEKLRDLNIKLVQDLDVIEKALSTLSKTDSDSVMLSICPLITDLNLTNIFISKERDESLVFNLDFRTGQRACGIAQAVLENANHVICGWNLKGFSKLYFNRFKSLPKAQLFDIGICQAVLSEVNVNVNSVFVQHMALSTPYDISRPESHKEASLGSSLNLLLAQAMKQALKNEGLYDFINQVELPLTPVIADMELAGVPCDQAELDAISKDVRDQMKQVENKIYKLSGQNDFNLASSAQLGKVLFESMGAAAGKKTKTGKYSTDEKALIKIATGKTKSSKEAEDVASLVLEYRSLSKFENTYVRGLSKAIDNTSTKRVYADFNQIGASSGRIITSKPNLQNIPMRTELGRRFRAAVRAPPGRLLLAADYEQIELRILAALSGDEGLIQAFAKGTDIHKLTASKMFNMDADDVTKEQRNLAKGVNYGIPYGISAYGLSENLNIPQKEAKALIDEYYRQFPKVERAIEELIYLAKSKSYAETILGRRRYLPEVASMNYLERSAAERIAVNMPIQGTQADMIKIAMVNIHKRLNENSAQSKLILQIHDELLFEIVPEEVDLIKEIVVDEMTHALALPNNVAVAVTLGTGDNWRDAH